MKTTDICKTTTNKTKARFTSPFMPSGLFYLSRGPHGLKSF